MMLDQWTAFKPGAEGGNLTDSSHGRSLTALTALVCQGLYMTMWLTQANEINFCDVVYL